MSQLTNNLILSVIKASNDRAAESPAASTVPTRHDEVASSAVRPLVTSGYRRFAVSFVTSAVLLGVVIYTAQQASAYIEATSTMNSNVIVQFGAAPGYAAAVAAGDAADAEDAANAANQASIK